MNAVKYFFAVWAVLIFCTLDASAQQETLVSGKLVGMQKISQDNFEIILREEDEMSVSSYEVRGKDAFTEKLFSNFANLRETVVSFYCKLNDDKLGTYYKGIYLRPAKEEGGGLASSLQNSGEKNRTNVFWKRNGNLYQLYASGKEIFGTKSKWFLKNDLLIYNPAAQTYYHCEDYKNKPMNELHEAKSVVYGKNVFAREENTYWLFIEGIDPPNSASMWSGDDLLVYANDTKKTYLLKNYANVKYRTLYNDVELFSEDTDAMWSADGKYYSLYVECEFVSDKLTSSYSGDDLIVYRAKTDRTYLFKDYKKLQDKKLRPAKSL